MLRNIFFIAIPLFVYLGLSPFIDNTHNLLLVTLIISTILFWATSLIPDYQTSLIFLFGALVFSLSPKEIIFSGFSSSAFWLVFAGMLIAASIKNVNLSHRFSSFFGKLQNPSYLKILITISIFSFIFAFIMPSGVGRVVLLVPLGAIVAKNFGFKEGSKGYTGILFTFILSTSLPAFSILTANVPNIILSGLTNEIYGFELLYSHYLLANFLIFGLLKDIILVTLIYYFYNDTPKIQSDIKPKEPITKQEKIVIYTIGIMLLFWSTDFLHGINPSIIAIIGVLFLMNPSIGIIQTKDINSINFSSLIFLATIISLGSMVANNDFTKEILAWILNLFDFSHSKFLNYMELSSSMALSATLLTQPTVPAIFTPVAEHLSKISGFSLNEIFMIEVSGFSTVFLPYQMPPIIIGLTLAKIKQTKMIKVLVLSAILTILFLYPLEYLWMKFIKLIY
jgi:di/tricarboxylate transporter